MQFYDIISMEYDIWFTFDSVPRTTILSRVVLLYTTTSSAFEEIQPDVQLTLTKACTKGGRQSFFFCNK